MASLCYVELATAYPHPGGDNHYVTRVFGKTEASPWNALFKITTDPIVGMARRPWLTVSMWGRSTSGKTTVVASTEGNQKGGDVYVGLIVYKK